MLGTLLALTLSVPASVHAIPVVLYVAPIPQLIGNCSSWGNVCTLQKALNDATSGNEIWVMKGIHKPGAARNTIFLLENGVKIYGGFAGTETRLEQRNWETNIIILSGDIGIVGDNSDNVFHVVTGNLLDTTVVLDGFTITGGNANGNSPNDRGGGMYNYQGSPRLEHLTFSGNLASTGSGGMYNEQRNPSLTDITFSDNTATEYGGGMFNIQSSPVLKNVTFSGNLGFIGGGMYNNNSSNPKLTNVTFRGNLATVAGGGMVNLESSNPMLTNVTFSGNSANFGGGMYNDQSRPELTNVTFSGNSANNGGGMCNSNLSFPVVKNTIL